MKTVFSIILTLMFICSLHAQSIFITSGKIEFEKRLSLHRIINDLWSDEPGAIFGIDEMKKRLPTGKNFYFDLYFDNNKTLYKPGRETTAVQDGTEFFLPTAKDNTVYSELDKQISISQKTVFENTYLLQDSIRQIQWRITPDTRTIAGFECRKAIGIIMDSVYVIAFYTDEIIPSGGPESFAGLPGMILGVAIPRINTTWFATKLEIQEVKPEQLAAPKKGKKADLNTIMVTLKDRMKDASKYGKYMVWNVMI